MNKCIFIFFLCGILFLPGYVFAESGNCIEGDCRDGKGTFVWPDGKQYTGDWQNGKRSGEGTSTWPDGAHYKGGYLENKKQG